MNDYTKYATKVKNKQRGHIFQRSRKKWKYNEYGNITNREATTKICRRAPVS